MTLGKIWLMDKPKPKWWITDSGKSFDSKAFAEEAAEADIGEQVTPGKAPWAHGMLERMVQRVKTIFVLIQKDCPNLDPRLVFYLTLGCINRQEVVRGFTPCQWAYGRGDTTQGVESEEYLHRQGYEDGTSEFALLLAAPQTLATTRQRHSKGSPSSTTPG